MHIVFGVFAGLLLFYLFLGLCSDIGEGLDWLTTPRPGMFPPHSRPFQGACNWYTSGSDGKPVRCQCHLVSGG